MRDRKLEELWVDGSSARPARFDPAQIAHLPSPARRYLTHAIRPGALVATAVRLGMHGEIKLKGSWCPFMAEQVIRWQRGFVWKARVTMKGLPVTGSDRWIDGEGSMRWKLLGLIPIVTASGPDISRAALGRVQLESIWLPTVLLAPDVHWQASDAEHVGVDLRLADHAAHLDLCVDPDGSLRTARIARWGNLDRKDEFHDYPFGGSASDEQVFDGIAIPTVLRVGWRFGEDRFETEGEFFRATVDHADFR